MDINSIKNFDIFLPFIVQELADAFKKDKELDYNTTNKIIYNSKLYKNLEKEETKMWYYSTFDLNNFLKNEFNYGDYVIWE